MHEYSDILKKYIPGSSVETVVRYLQQYKIHLRISRNRNTKLGDYRPPAKSGIHRISVNYDLNEFAFLITLIHETAHVHTWVNFKNKVKPHGKEWKKAFHDLMQPLLEDEAEVFPEDIIFALKKYLRNAKASSGSDVNLSRILSRYDENSYTVVEDLPFGAVFRVQNGKTFKKQEKRRTRYKCMCLDDKRIYTINPLVKVEQIK